MIKRRNLDRDIDSFAAAADSTQEPSLNPYAKRDYKSINVSFNEYEYEILESAANKDGRSKLSFIRHAISELARRELDN